MGLRILGFKAARLPLTNVNVAMAVFNILRKKVIDLEDCF